MKVSVKVALFGVAAGALILGGGALNEWRLQKHTDRLETECKATATAIPPLVRFRKAYPMYSDMSDEQLVKALHQKYYPHIRFSDFAKRFGLRETTATASNPFDQFDMASPLPPGFKLDLPASWNLDPLVCDANVLSGAGESTGIQLAIVQADEAAKTSGETARVAALAVVLVSLLPWLWYFLLRRVAEVRLAVSGKPPER